MYHPAQTLRKLYPTLKHMCPSWIEVLALGSLFSIFTFPYAFPAGFCITIHPLLLHNHSPSAASKYWGFLFLTFPCLSRKQGKMSVQLSQCSVLHSQNKLRSTIIRSHLLQCSCPGRGRGQTAQQEPVRRPRTSSPACTPCTRNQFFQSLTVQIREGAYDITAAVKLDNQNLKTIRARNAIYQTPISIGYNRTVNLALTFLALAVNIETDLIHLFIH